MKKLMIIFLLLIGCKGSNDEKDQIIDLIGKQIVIDEACQSVSVNGKDSMSQSAFTELNKPIKIITYIDSSSCTGCAMQILLEWNSLLRDIHSDSVGFIPVVYPTDKNKLIVSLKNLSLSTSLLYDTNNQFLINNNLLSVFARNRTFILDRNNNIVVVGEPFQKRKMLELYKKKIIKLIRNGGLYDGTPNSDR